MPLLYRYIFARDHREALERLRQIVEENKLFAANPSGFNDPFEFKFAVQVSDNDEAVLAAYRKVKQDATIEDVESLRQDIQIPATRRHVETSVRNLHFQDLRIICFSQTGEDPLMWSHYSNGGRTFCVVFDLAVLEPTLPLKVWGPVIYTDAVPIYRFDKVFTDFMPLLICSKHSRWQYEGEYRLAFTLPPLHFSLESEIAARKASPGILVGFNPKALKGIILGSRPYPELFDYASSHSVRADFIWGQMLEAEGAYQLHQVPLSIGEPTGVG